MKILEVLEDYSVIRLATKWGMGEIRYLKVKGKLQCLEGGYEDVPFIDDIPRNPYSEFSDKHENVERVITAYNNIEGGLKDSAPSYSFY